MPGNPLTDPNWASSLADNIERYVGIVRDKTTKPLLVAYRGVVFGVIALFGGIAAAVLFTIFLTRGLQAILEWPLNHHDAVWVSYLAVGAVFVLVGTILMRKRHDSELAS
jgi:Mn2+/Fe2+ NRAMP family transporter